MCVCGGGGGGGINMLKNASDASSQRQSVGLECIVCKVVSVVLFVSCFCILCVCVCVWCMTFVTATIMIMLHNFYPAALGALQ